MLITSFITSFLSTLRVEAGLSANTIAAYRNDLERLFEVVKTNDPKAVTAQDISGFIAQSDDGAATVKRRLACYRQFFKHWGNGAAAQVEVPKQEHRLPKPVAADRLKEMFDLTTDTGERLVLELLYACGLRASELQTAKMEGDMVRVRGKGNKDRLVPSTPFIREWLPKVTGCPHRTTIWRIVQRAAARIGMDVHPHQLRHSFATHLLTNGCPINAISAMMGHESLCTTAGYMQLDTRAKRRTIEQFHPRERVTA